MTITVLTSAAGSPGVTTTALGLTLDWPDSCLLVDADYQQAVLTGYLRGEVITTNGLLRLIDAARISPDLREAIARQWIELPGDDPAGLRRRLLPGLVSAQTSDALFKTWPAISNTLRELSDTGIDAIIDLGRMDWRGIHPALLDAATTVLLMSAPTLRAAGAATWAAQRLREQARDTANAAKLGVIVVRPPALALGAVTNAGREERGGSDRELADWFEIPVRGQVLRDPVNARVLSDGATPGPKFAKSAYAASLSQLAQKLHQLTPSERGQR